MSRPKSNSQLAIRNSQETRPDAPGQHLGLLLIANRLLQEAAAADARNKAQRTSTTFPHFPKPGLSYRHLGPCFSEDMRRIAERQGGQTPLFFAILDAYLI